jgi:hypothetical protein
MRLSRASLETDNTSDGLLDPDSTSNLHVLIPATRPPKFAKRKV